MWWKISAKSQKNGRNGACKGSPNRARIAPKSGSAPDERPTLNFGFGPLGSRIRPSAAGALRPQRSTFTITCLTTV